MKSARHGLLLGAALLLAAILPTRAPAAGSDWRLGGYLKSLDLYLAAPPAGPQGSGTASSNRARLDLTGPLGKEVDFEASVEDQLLFSDPAGLPAPARATR